MVPTSVPKRSRIFNLFLVVAVGVVSAVIIYKVTLESKIQSETRYADSSIFRSEKLKECRPVCITEDCLYIANEIIRKMNLNSNPCENFFSYACGGLIETVGNYTSYYSLEDQERLMYVTIKDVIEKSSGPVGSLTEKLKLVYESCMNEETSDLKSIQTILIFLSEIGISNWPNLNSNFTFENTSLEDVLGKLYSYDEAVFFSFYAQPFKFDGTRIYNLTVYPQNRGMNKFLSIEEMEKLLSEILSYLDMESLNSSQIVRDYLEIETSVRMLLMENENNAERNCYGSNSSNTCTFVDCTQEKTSNEAFICNVLKSAVRSIRAESALNTDGYELCCPHSFYVENIVSVTGNYTHRALANYMALNVFMNNFEYLKFSLRRKRRRLLQEHSYRFETKKINELNRWKFCIQFLTKYMPYNLGLIYARKMFPGNSLEEIDEIFKDIKYSVADSISQQDWIEDSMKKRISDEARNINNDFNEAIIRLNETELNMIYQKFEFNPNKGDFLQNVLECKRVYFSAVSSGYGVYGIGTLSFDSGATSGSTSVTLGLGVLLPFIYKYGFDKLFNYATMGQVIGHEIGHIMYYHLWERDTNDETLAHQEERLFCLKEQYSKFFIEAIGKNVDGEKTLDENFADALSRKATEKVVQNYLTNMTENFFLPGLPYSTEELFYIVASQLWCAVETTKRQEFHYHSSYHSPRMFRALGVLQNSERFSQVFNCEPNSFMNPDKKCSILDM